MTGDGRTLRRGRIPIHTANACAARKGDSSSHPVGDPIAASVAVNPLCRAACAPDLAMRINRCEGNRLPTVGDPTSRAIAAQVARQAGTELLADDEDGAEHQQYDAEDAR